MKRLAVFASILVLISCNHSEESIAESEGILEGIPSITGKAQYLDSPYVTAGNRVYMVGHQNGSFPDLGWHIKGEMGGIWNHPIKLFDGFTVAISKGNKDIILDQANQFTNYPFANSHSYDLEGFGINVERWQFVPDDSQGIFIQFKIKNTSDSDVEIDFYFGADSDLRPTWLGERTNMIDSKDQARFNKEQNAMIFKDSLNPWYAIAGMDLPMNFIENGKITSNKKGANLGATTPLALAAGQEKSISITLAGSYLSQKEAIQEYQNIQSNWQTLANNKKKRYKELANKSVLKSPDTAINKAFEWLKYNSDWLIRTVPEVGTGITAGIPDYPWWFGVDSEYALKGYMTIGQTEVVYQTIDLLDSVSMAVNGNGRIIHEMSTNGAVFNPGNINETPQFASLIWEVYKWNGDKTFLEKYYPTIEKGLDWLFAENDSNNNLFPDGFGMMEIHGMDSEMIDVAVYTQRALADAGSIANELGKDTAAKAYREKAKKLKNKINTEFWSDQFNSYADFIGTDQQALHLIEDAIVRADTLNKPWAVEELKSTRDAILQNPSDQPRPFVLHHNWVVNTPMEMGIAPYGKAIKALATAEQFVNPFGMFVTGIDRDESAGSDDGSFKGSKTFSYTGAVMTLPTAVQIVGENNYLRPERALNYLRRMTRSFSYALPGSMYEVSPDYGMITQAWNIYGYGVPIVQQFFGVQPEASERRVRIHPQMPRDWNKASLENVLIGDNQISIDYNDVGSVTTITVSQTKDWNLELIVEVREDGVYEYDKDTAVFGKDENGNNMLTSTAKSMSITIRNK